MIIQPAYLRIVPDTDLPDIGRHRWFRAIVILDGVYSEAWQDKVSRWLVDAGCLYMMAWGPNCTTWDDSVDLAQIEKFLPGEAPENEFVMTTWHDNESLEEVFWFAQMCAYDAYDRIENILIVHIGERERERELLSLFDVSRTFADRGSEIEMTKSNRGWFQRLFGN